MEAEEQQEAESPKQLTAKQRAFIVEYCQDFNATQAAIRAGYSPNSAAESACENLKKSNVKAAIDEYLDALSMGKGEAAKRLTAWGRGTFEPFVERDEDQGLVLKLDKPEALANIHLIKKLKQTKRVTKIDDEVIAIDYTTEIELHDPMAAVDKIAKIRGMYVEKTTLDVGDNVGELTFHVRRSNKETKENPPQV
jgi:phage terminase small subunit